jgi:hypothetical protein
MCEGKEVIIVDNDKEYKATIVKKNLDGTFIVKVNEDNLRVYPEDLKKGE